MAHILNVFLNVLYASVTTSILIGIYLIIKKCFFKQKGIRYHHMIWLILMIRLLIPFNIIGASSILEKLNEAVLNEVEANIGENVPQIMMFSPAKNETYKLEQDEEFKKNHIIIEDHSRELNKNKEKYALILSILSKIWICGVVGVAILFLIATMKFKVKSRNGRKPIDPDIQLIKQKCTKIMKIKRVIPIYMSTYYKSPFICGIMMPSIYLPENVYHKIDEAELKYIILHEMAHYKRKDLIYNFMTVMVLILHWFNPLMWFVIKDIRYDREVLCDAYVMEKIENDEIIPYGKTLIFLSKIKIRKYNEMCLVGFHELNSKLEGRIKMISKFKKGSYKLSVVAIIFSVIVGIIIVTSPLEAKHVNDISESLVQEECIEKQVVMENSNEDLEEITNANKNQINDTKETQLNEIEASYNMRILIDPGHGGKDLGANYNDEIAGIDIKEKDINLEVAGVLYDMFKGSGVEVSLTREEDVYVTIQEREQMINKLKPKFIISIHVGAGPSEIYQGMRVLFNDKETSNVSAKRIAQILNNDNILEMQNWLALYNVSMPAVNIEVGNLSNSTDRENLMDKDYQREVAMRIKEGVMSALKEMNPEIKLKWPLTDYHRMSSPYGYRTDPFENTKYFHRAIDIPALKGTPILASQKGIVIRAEYDKDYGNTIEIDHENGMKTVYCNASKLEANLGDRVKIGQKIGEVGSTGKSTGSHLHFEVWVNGKHCNPLEYLQNQ